MITLFWSSVKENCCLLRSQHKGKLDEKFRSVTCRVYYYLFRDWNLWHLFRGISIFSLLEKSFLSHPWKLHGIAPYKPMRRTWVVWGSDGWTHSGRWISQLLLLQPSQLLHLLFTKLKWSVKKKKSISLVSRQLFLIFWMDYASFIFCNRF